jgi:uncharacterized protein (DUF1330 family)
MIREEMTDADAFAVYAKAAPKASAGHAVKPLAFYGKHEVLEGEEAEAVAILEFPDYEQAKAWYDSREYQEAMKNRLKGARYRVLVVEGL